LEAASTATRPVRICAGVIAFAADLPTSVVSALFDISIVAAVH
jgi:hypothetical protein